MGVSCAGAPRLVLHRHLRPRVAGASDRIERGDRTLPPEVRVGAPAAWKRGVDEKASLGPEAPEPERVRDFVEQEIVEPSARLEPGNICRVELDTGDERGLVR